MWLVCLMLWDFYLKLKMSRKMIPANQITALCHGEVSFYQPIWWSKWSFSKYSRMILQISFWLEKSSLSSCASPLLSSQITSWLELVSLLGNIIMPAAAVSYHEQDELKSLWWSSYFSCSAVIGSKSNLFSTLIFDQIAKLMTFPSPQVYFVFSAS